MLKTVLIAPSTLTASYGAITGVMEIHPNISDIVLYFGYLAGTNGDTLKASVMFSPDDTTYFSECNDEIQTTDTILRAKDYTMVDVAGATPTSLFDEFLGKLEATDVASVQTYLSNKQRLKSSLIPVTTTTPVIRHDGTAFGTVTEKVNDAAFTAPAAGTVQWSLSTGNLNFASADLVSYVGQRITIDYTTKYNLFRTVVPVSDHYVKVGLKDVAAAGHGTAFCWISYGSNFK